MTYTIGFSNLSERIPFAVTVREGLESAAKAHKIQIIARDNDFDNEKALANAQEFAKLGVDLAIIFHIDERLGMEIRQTLFTAKPRIPIIAVDIPVPLEVFFGIDNYRAGFLAGEALAQWGQRKWDGKLDRILVMTEQRAVSTIRTRLESAVEGILSLIDVEKNHILHLDGSTQYEVANERSKAVLQSWLDWGVEHIGVVCSNDDMAMGVLHAAREMSIEEHIAVIGQGANLIWDEFQNNPDTHFIASSAYYPERYGEHIIDLAVRMLNDEKVPMKNHIDPIIITKDNYKQHLPTETTD